MIWIVRLRPGPIAVVAMILWGLTAAIASPATTARLNEHAHCLGRIENFETGAAVGGRAAQAYGSIFVRFAASVIPADSTYIHHALLDLYPVLAGLLGEPQRLDTLTIHIWDRGGGAMGKFVPHMTLPHIRSGRGIDEDSDGRVDEDPNDRIDNDADGRIDEDLETDAVWDGIFAHEMTHAFLFGSDNDFESWLEEGLADASVYFATQPPAVRRLSLRAFSRGVSNFDLNNAGSAQIFGGVSDLVFRPDTDRCYEMAAATMIIPCLAELAARPDLPHPLGRLVAALWEEEISAAAFHSVFDVMDRAWRTPIDGIFPPSRWVRGSAVSAPDVRDGLFYAILPVKRGSGLNPRRFDFIMYRRGRDGEGSFVSGPLTFRGAGESQVITVPAAEYEDALLQLPNGAWRVEGIITDETQAVASGRSWFLKTPAGESNADSRQGVAVIFLDRDGTPLDVSGFSVNGRIVEKVPGGAVVAPVSGLQPDGALTFQANGRIIGTVTVPGNLTRVLTLCVDAPEQRSAVEWFPLTPVAGKPLRVSLRSDLSALAGPDGPIQVSLCNLSGETIAQSFMTSLAGSVWQATLSVPEDMTAGSLKFTSRLSEHGTCGTRPGAWTREPVFTVGVAADDSPVSVTRLGNSLVIAFADPWHPEGLHVRVADSSAGPWMDVADLPDIDELHHRVTWPLPESMKERVYLQVLRREFSADRVLITEVLGPTVSEPFVEALAPFPNPSRDGFRWMLNIDRPTTLDFEVFAVSGRRVAGPARTAFVPGVREIVWQGMMDGHPAPSGIYLLRLTGNGQTVLRKVVLASGR